MTNFTLYRKEIDMLGIIKQQFLNNQFHGGYRESVAELFQTSNNHLRDDFLDIIPVERLEWAKELISFLSTVNSSGSGSIGSIYRGNRKVVDVIADITELQELIATECNKRFRYGVFYSWQSDTEGKYTRNFIEDAIEKSIKKVNGEVSAGPRLSLDKDTRGVPGSPDIVNTILQKIDRSVCFIADITLIGNIGNKKVVNPNVMLELGYALSSLGYERVILVCNTAFGELKELPFDLGLKRVISYKYDLNCSDEEKKACKEALVSKLFDAMKAIVSL